MFILKIDTFFTIHCIIFFIKSKIILHLLMPKPKGQKNTKNKAKHSKLIARKVNKQKAEKALRKERLKEIIKRAKGEE